MENLHREERVVALSAGFFPCEKGLGRDRTTDTSFVLLELPCLNRGDEPNLKSTCRLHSSKVLGQALALSERAVDSRNASELLRTTRPPNDLQRLPRSAAEKTRPLEVGLLFFCSRS